MHVYVHMCHVYMRFPNHGLQLNVLIVTQHWNGNAAIFMKFPSPVALDVMKITTSNAGNDENFVKMMIIPFQ